MGWTVLYIAFGVVALWLLGEVLLQYKARLRWRLVAFCGFLCVVVGVLLPSVPVIAGGTVAFALGQTFVTLSFRRGFSTGWALGGKPGTSRRRRGRQNGEMRPLEPLADDPAADPSGYDAFPPPPPAPEQLPGPDGFEGPEEREAPYGEGYAEGYTEEIYPDAPQQPYEPAAPDTTVAADYGAAAAYQEPYGDPGYPGQQNGDSYGTAYEPPYEPAYAAYQDPYPGAAEEYADYGGQQPAYPGDYAPEYQGGQQQPYAAGYEMNGGGWPGEGAAPPGEPAYYQETPPGGVWVPQQRDPGEPDPGAVAPPPYGQPEGEYYFGQFDQERRY